MEITSYRLRRPIFIDFVDKMVRGPLIVATDRMEAGVRRNYRTLSETIVHLKGKGYTHDFNIANIFSGVLSPTDFEIDRVHRFEGATNPDDQCILYAISSPRLGVKGILVNGYGLSAVDETNEVVSQLRTHS